MDHSQERRRGHYRGRRGPDRRGPDRRFQPPQGQPRDQVDVEQIMRDIKIRIAQRHGVDLSSQQIDELAARRLEYILDPRALKPEFLQTIRGRAQEFADQEQIKLPSEPVYSFEDTTLYDSHRWVLRFIRKLLNPLLKLFFNPNPLIRALHLQAQLNVESARREAERERRYAEWNALHYKIVERMVTEVSRLTLELQQVSLRIDSLNARVDFCDRRVRSMAGAQPLRQPARPADSGAPMPPADAVGPGDVPAEGAGDSTRRRRRRRRGRRGPGSPEGISTPTPAAPLPVTAAGESPDMTPAETREPPPAPFGEPEHEAGASPDSSAAGEPGEDGSEP